MLVNPCLTSSIMAGSSHYQPCCFYYTSTSSALIRINMLRYRFMFAPFSLDACLNTEPGTGLQHWSNLLHESFLFSAFHTSLWKSSPPNFPAFTSHSFCSLTHLAVYLVLVRDRTQQPEVPRQQQKVYDGYHNQDVKQCKQMKFQSKVSQLEDVFWYFLGCCLQTSPIIIIIFFYSNWAPKKQKSMSEKGQFET